MVPRGQEPLDTRLRWAFLAEASRHLADSLDYETTLETVAALSLPQLGSWSMLDLTEPDGSIRRLAVIHPDPEKEAIARELKAGWPPQRDDPMGISAVAQSGKSELIAEVTDELLMKVARGEENLRRLRALGISSVMTVPMRARGMVLGAITFVSSSRERSFHDTDLSLAEDLAERCALAIDNARLHRAAYEVAEAEVARLKAEAANRIKSEFLSTVGHELRTPLNVIAGYLELLAMNVAGPLTARQREYVEGIQSGEQQLLRVVEDMLNFVRLVSGEIRYERVDFSLHRVVTEVCETYRPDLEARGLELQIRCDTGARAQADPPKVWQILLNLLSNARKFTDSGGTITVECETTEDLATVRVRDTGCGIPPEKAERIFEPFVQADSSLTRRAEGMGLGLSISRHLARDMGGDLRVETGGEDGCTFILTLPPAQG